MTARKIETLGQEGVAKALSAYVDTVARGGTLLFHGPRGLGKDFVARGLMKALNCTDPGRCGESGPTCGSCRKVEHFNHPDFHYVFPVVRSGIRSSTDKSFQQFSRENTELVEKIHVSMARDPFFHPSFEKVVAHTIDTVRNILREAYKKLYEGRVGVTVIASCHLMTREAANALLKVLEEPPETRVFVLTTESPETLLPTILSRCRRIRFVPLAESAVRSVLLDHYDLDEEAAAQLARRSQGLPGEAIRLHEESRLPLMTTAREFFREISGGRSSRILARAEEAAAMSREEVLGLLDELVLFYRDTMVLADGASKETVVQAESAEVLEDLARRGALGDPGRGLARIERARYEIQRNANTKLCLVRMALDLADSGRAAAGA